MRLRCIGCIGSDSDEEEAEESLAIAEGLAVRIRERCAGLGEASTD